ncbi:beta-N-acetylhexosaminidase [Polaribacter cellanae]|uniref:beta-N-acetylhexosaminidase n=1 Tax=Polaribacter cellanae TaxID=2818493 RepID=A0A975CPR2_9FLAO|nr:family 20 glycosylhydrolase [Polaribacter cellanae]QTE22445.1 family 20 glycosylhydrolase [Polaribacter cellanae]
MKISHYFLVLFIAILSSCNNQIKKPIEPNIIPIPLSQKIQEGVFILDSSTSIITDNQLKNVSDFFTSFLKDSYNLNLSDKKEKNSIQFKIDASIKNEEGYTLKVEKNIVSIAAKTAKGAFYGVQSFIQLLPVKSASKQIAVQCLDIKDEPRFVYRGMHLDVGRHFFSVDFIKKYINIMSMLKMNTFHWHLTEDQGWRIEIKKYPKLQEIAAFRKETLIGSYANKPHKFDGKKYGGFYTQEEIKEVVKYATERQVTVIPEIEMPGHSQAAIAAYPELGCTGKQVEVATKWGVFDEVYCPNEKTFQFLEDVIDEIIPLFPGKYIHIGGDEAPKTRWKNCDYCQKLIKKEGLKDEHELQSYFITRMEKYINSKGKQIIGWDEILEGGLAPNATVMSWRGIAGAIKAAKEKHDVILTPNTHCYFDHYQSKNPNEPLAIGGFLPLRKVYNFNPIPEELTKEEEKYVLGAQGNLWTEYIPTEDQAEYMAFPRAIALAEVVWSSKENRNYNNFVKRLAFFNERLDAMDVNYANHLYEIKGTLHSDVNKISYQLEAPSQGKVIRFTTDGSEPDKNSKIYSEEILITKNTEIKAATFNAEGKKLSSVFTKKIQPHKAVGQKVSLNVNPHRSYNEGGIKALTNGIYGSDKSYEDKEWLGFNGDDVEVTIEFDKPTEINSISTRFHNGNSQWIYAPKEVTIKLELENGKVVLSKNKLADRETTLIDLKFNFAELNTDKQKVKSLKLTIPNYGIIPKGNPGEGNKAWTFIDEIIVK